MKKPNNYVAGPHDFWVHFWCGLIFGAFLGLWIGSNLFDEGWAIAATSLISALVMGFSCGHWGDQAWEWVMSGLGGFF
jgi:hypothetical protein